MILQTKTAKRLELLNNRLTGKDWREQQAIINFKNELKEIIYNKQLRWDDPDDCYIMIDKIRKYLREIESVEKKG